MVPFFGLGRCVDKCRPEQKPEARSGFRTNKIESVDAVVCCVVGAGSSTHSAGQGQTHGLRQTLPDTGLCGKSFLPFLSSSAVVCVGLTQLT